MFPKLFGESLIKWLKVDSSYPRSGFWAGWWGPGVHSFGSGDAALGKRALTIFFECYGTFFVLHTLA